MLKGKWEKKLDRGWIRLMLTTKVCNSIVFGLQADAESFEFVDLD